MLHLDFGVECVKADDVPELAHRFRGSKGVRLKNCELNTGRGQYAFNSLQRQTLPSCLRPPQAFCSGGPS